MISLGTVLAERYRLVRFIARGGMGEVYEAHDRTLDKLIAVKLLTSCANREEQLQQLRAEVENAHRVTHKYVCRTFDLGLHKHETGEQTPFITMELIAGRSLSERIRAEGALSHVEACRIGVYILEGLQAAHEAGVLHRDLKSDNVMLRDDRGPEPFPVLMDFGLSKSLTAHSTSASDGQSLAGTLAYMAPEQLQGRKPRVATDLYAFGTVMFEMLTGRLPFLGSTPALQALRRLQEPAPSILEFSAQATLQLADFVAACLQQDPSARPASARSACDALRKVLDDLPQLSPAGRVGPGETRSLDRALAAAGAPTIKIPATDGGVVTREHAATLDTDAVERLTHSDRAVRADSVGASRSSVNDITGPPTTVGFDEVDCRDREKVDLSVVRRSTPLWGGARSIAALGGVVLVVTTGAVVFRAQSSPPPTRAAVPSVSTYSASTGEEVTVPSEPALDVPPATPSSSAPISSSVTPSSPATPSSPGAEPSPKPSGTPAAPVSPLGVASEKAPNRRPALTPPFSSPAPSSFEAARVITRHLSSPTPATGSTTPPVRRCPRGMLCPGQRPSAD